MLVCPAVTMYVSESTPNHDDTKAPLVHVPCSALGHHIAFTVNMPCSALDHDSAFTVHVRLQRDYSCPNERTLLPFISYYQCYELGKILWWFGIFANSYLVISLLNFYRNLYSDRSFEFEHRNLW